MASSTTERPMFESFEQAKEEATRCLTTLANVQQYVERNHKGKEIDLVETFQMVGTAEKDTCGRKALPHLHAKLNGIPVILSCACTRSGSSSGGGSRASKNQPEVIVVSSSTDLLIKMNRCESSVSIKAETFRAVKIALSYFPDFYELEKTRQ